MIDRINKKYFMMAVNGTKIGKESDVDIAVRCPICGDSSKNKRSTRLHLYSKGDLDLVHCFNGDCQLNDNKTVYSFLRDFYPNLLSQYKRENFSHTMQSLANGDVFSNVKQIKEKDNTNIVTYNLSPYMLDINKSEEALEYLRGRLCEYDEKKYGKWYYGNQNLFIDGTHYNVIDSIIIPLYHNDEMYGFYSRKIKEKTFCTYMNDVNIGYKVWNWFNVDKNKPVYIFEGIFDAISSGLDNCIAAIGAKIPDERIKELKEPVFVLDNDRTGLNNSLTYAKKGYSVYVQPNEYTEKDMNELAKNHKEVNIVNLVKSNIWKGISAEIRIKSKL